MADAWERASGPMVDLSPSQRDGVSAEDEDRILLYSSFFLESCGHLVGASKVSIATALLYLRRFYERQSLLRHDHFLVAETCLFLAVKVEEGVQLFRDIILKCRRLRRQDAETQSCQSTKDADRNEDIVALERERILVCERVLLQTLAFELHAAHPFDVLQEKVPWLLQTPKKGKERALASFGALGLAEEMGREN